MRPASSTEAVDEGLIPRSPATRVGRHDDLIIAIRTDRLVLPRSYDRALATIVDNAGLPRLTSHGFRHTAAGSVSSDGEGIGGVSKK